MKVILGLLVVLVLTLGAWSLSSARIDLDTAMRETVVLSDGMGGASGVVIGPHTILTAWHVAEHQGLKVETFDHRKFDTVTTWSYAGGDFALVEVKEDLGLPAAPLSCRPMRVGQHVTVIGHPFLEIMWNVTQGYVSTLQPIRVQTGMEQQGILVGLDVTAAPGNSGGPVFDDLGRVVGLLDAGRGSSDNGGGLSFAIPMSEACRTLPHL